MARAYSMPLIENIKKKRPLQDYVSAASVNAQGSAKAGPARAAQNSAELSRLRQNSYRSRADSILADGSRATEYAKVAAAKQKQRIEEERRRKEQEKFRRDMLLRQQQEEALRQAQATQPGQNMPQNMPGPMPTGGGAGDINRYLAGLRQVESGGNYSARSKISTASGAYQYINSTWNNYGGYKTAGSAPRSVQDKRAREDALRAFNSFGNWEQVAANHFYPAYARDRSKWNIAPGRGNPTVQNYVRKVMTAMGGNSPAAVAARPVSGDVSGIRNQIVKNALGYEGVVPYVWGGATPKGFDCSGLTQYVYKQSGINIPRTSGPQSTFGQRTNIKYARPGDLVGWNKGGHIAIYIGNGKIVQSSRPGTKVNVRSLAPGEGVFAVRLTLPGD